MIGWCMGAIVTVMVGAEGFKELEEQEDPLLQAILTEGSFGSILLLKPIKTAFKSLLKPLKILSDPLRWMTLGLETGARTVARSLVPRGFYAARPRGLPTGTQHVPDAS